MSNKVGFEPPPSHVLEDTALTNVSLLNVLIDKSKSSLVEGKEGSYLLNSQTNLVMVLGALSPLLCNFTNTTAIRSDLSLHLLLLKSSMVESLTLLPKTADLPINGTIS